MAVNPTPGQQSFLTPPPAATMSSLSSSSSSSTTSEIKTAKVAPSVIVQTTTRRNSTQRPDGAGRFALPLAAPELPKKPDRAGTVKKLDPQLVAIAQRGLVTGFARKLEAEAGPLISADEMEQMQREGIGYATQDDMLAFVNSAPPLEDDDQSPPCTERARRMLVGLGGPAIPNDPLEPDKYVFQNAPFSVAQLNKEYGKCVPENFEEFEPDQPAVLRPVLVSPSQMEALRKIEQDEKIVKLGEVEIHEPILESLISIFNGDLREFILHRCPTIRNVDFLTRCEDLQQLIISYCENLRSDCFGVIPEKLWAHLLHLKLPGNPEITDETIISLPILPCLRDVDLSHCKKITSKGILDLFKHPKLEKIWIDGIPLGRREITDLEARKPEALELCGTPSVKPDEIEDSINWPYLKGFIEEITRGKKREWKKLDELQEWGKRLDRDIHKDIKDFYERHLHLRGIRQTVDDSLETQAGWIKAEAALQVNEGRNIQIITEVLVSNIIKTIKNERIDVKVEFGNDCFENLSILMHNPKLTKLVTELDLSNKGLDEIPLSFLDLCLTRLKVLNLSGNKKITKLPGPYKDWNGRARHHWHNFASLETLDLSFCSITSLSDEDPALGNLFYTNQPIVIDEEKEELEEHLIIDPKLYVLQELKHLLLEGNQITSLPDVMGISKKHGEQLTNKEKSATQVLSKTEVTKKQIEMLVDQGFFPNYFNIDLRRNKITQITQATVNSLGAANPVCFVLRLAGNKLGVYPLPRVPKTVVLDMIEKQHKELVDAFKPPEEGKRE